MTLRTPLRSLVLLVCVACHPAMDPGPRSGIMLPTGKRLDPAGRTIELGNMPLSAAVAPGGRYLIVALSGWRERGIEVVDLETGRVVQHLEQAGAFLGLAFTRDARSLWASGAGSDLLYRYTWHDGRATLADSVSIRPAGTDSTAPRFPAGIALSPDGHRLYAAENMADSLAVVDLRTQRVVQRVAAGRYPCNVVIGSEGTVYVSEWGGSSVLVYRPLPEGRLAPALPVTVGKNPSALLLNAEGNRLYVTSASTDRVSVVDTRSLQVIATLADAAPGGPPEGSTPDALALSPDGLRLFIAEADNNAVAVYRLATATAGRSGGAARDTLLGRIPTWWYPTALALTRSGLAIVSGKGRGAGANPTGPVPGVDRFDPRGYTLGQLDGILSMVPVDATPQDLDSLTHRAELANGWNATPSPATYPPLRHAILIIKENRTYDQVLGDIPAADGDSSLVFFPRPVSPNHHALAERFGLFDRFFVNAEVSAQGHPWSTAAYVTEYTEKTTPLVYDDKRPETDDPDEVDLPALGFIWSRALEKGLSVRNYGEYGVPVAGASGNGMRFTSRMPGLGAVTSPAYPPFDLRIPDQRRADVWIEELEGFAARGDLPALEIMHLPGDHTAGARRGYGTPRAYMADNDLALGRIVQALSESPFWNSSVIFVLEDDAQAGPDHVSSHRSVLLVISAYSRPGPIHRFVNTTDVLATIEQILGLEALSQFDHYGRPLSGWWTATPDLRPYTALTPSQPLTELNTASGPDAAASQRMNLADADRIDDAAFNLILWHALKAGVPYPRAARRSTLEISRGN